MPAGLYSISIEGTLSGDNEALITSMYSRVNSVSIVDNQGWNETEFKWNRPDRFNRSSRSTLNKW